MKKIKKQYKLIILLIILLIIIVFIRNIPKDYSQKYHFNDILIIEKYQKETSEYTFSLEYNNKKYIFVIEAKPLKTKQLIEDVKIFNKENITCLQPIIKELSTYPLCSNESEIISYDLSSTKYVYNYKKIQAYDKPCAYDINTLNGKNLLIYNYKGFSYISNRKNKDINLFTNDVYTINIIYQMQEYILIADYNSEHYFKKLYVINMKNGSVSEIETEQEISFDSIFLGDYNKKVYLLDKKEKKEYIINPARKTLRETNFKILKNQKLIDTTYNEIVTNNLKFDNNKNQDYIIENNTLYEIHDNIKIKISDKFVDKIIKVDGRTVYYLSGEYLYFYNHYYGNVLLMKNFEWNFNNNNMIFIY